MKMASVSPATATAVNRARASASRRPRTYEAPARPAATTRGTATGSGGRVDTRVLALHDAHVGRVERSRPLLGLQSQGHQEGGHGDADDHVGEGERLHDG